MAVPGWGSGGTIPVGGGGGRPGGGVAAHVRQGGADAGAGGRHQGGVRGAEGAGPAGRADVLALPRLPRRPHPGRGTGGGGAAMVGRWWGACLAIQAREQQGGSLAVALCFSLSASVHLVGGWMSMPPPSKDPRIRGITAVFQGQGFLSEVVLNAYEGFTQSNFLAFFFVFPRIILTQIVVDIHPLFEKVCAAVRIFVVLLFGEDRLGLKFTQHHKNDSLREFDSESSPQCRTPLPMNRSSDHQNCHQNLI